MKINFLTLVAALAGIALLSGCARTCNCSLPLSDVKPAISFQEMSKMPPFTASVEDVDVHRSIFSSRTSVKLQLLTSNFIPELNLESYPASKTIVGFVQSLEGGKCYVFPKVYLDYMNHESAQASTAAAHN